MRSTRHAATASVEVSAAAGSDWTRILDVEGPGRGGCSALAIASGPTVASATSSFRVIRGLIGPVGRSVGLVASAAVCEGGGMAKKAVPVPAPSVITEAVEENRFLAAFVVSLAKRWSVTRSVVLVDARQLALCWWALDRPAPAVELLAGVTEVVTGPVGPDGRSNYDLWTPVAGMNALQARIGREQRDGSGAAAAARFLADPALAPNRDFIVSTVVEAAGRIDESVAEKSPKWACQGLAVELAALVPLGELAVAGHEYAAWYDSDAVEELIGRARTALAERLRAAA